jgi:hypothetical protein
MKIRALLFNEMKNLKIYILVFVLGSLLSFAYDFIHVRYGVLYYTTKQAVERISILS